MRSRNYRHLDLHRFNHPYQNTDPFLRDRFMPFCKNCKTCFAPQQYVEDGRPAIFNCVCGCRYLLINDKQAKRPCSGSKTELKRIKIKNYAEYLACRFMTTLYVFTLPLAQDWLGEDVSWHEKRERTKHLTDRIWKCFDPRYGFYKFSKSADKYGLA